MVLTKLPGSLKLPGRWLSRRLFGMTVQWGHRPHRKESLISADILGGLNHGLGNSGCHKGVIAQQSQIRLKGGATRQVGQTTQEEGGKVLAGDS